MAASTCCSRFMWFSAIVLILCTIPTNSQPSKCSRINNSLEYESGRCIFVERWAPSSMKEAEAACGNLSNDVEWTLPKFDSSTVTKAKEFDAISRALSIKKSVFWLGLVQKNEVWKWLEDGSDLDEMEAMWKNGNEKAGMGDCVLGEWDGQIKWIAFPCRLESMVSSNHDHLLVCESKSRNRSPREKREKMTSTRSTIDTSPRDPRGKLQNGPLNSSDKPDSVGPTTWQWVVVGVCLALILGFVIFGSVFYVRHRRKHEADMNARQDSLGSGSSGNSPSSDDSIKAFNDSPSSKRKKDGMVKKLMAKKGHKMENGNENGSESVKLNR